jgi:hypothetical protein
LGRQFIINIRVFTHLEDGSIEDHYHSFVDYIVPQDKHCINIDMQYYYADPKKDSTTFIKKANAINSAECERIYNEIKNIYYSYKDKEPSANKQVNSAYKLINKLTTIDIYNYYLQIAMCNQQLGINHINV